MTTPRQPPAVETFALSTGDGVPNNPALPLLVYRGVVADAADKAAAFEALFQANGWGDGWRDGIYGYHHFHTTAHEALGIAAGHARVRFGGEGGVEAEVRAGDMVVIPAGVGHKNLGASDDFLVVGAYPRGTEPDMNRPAPDRLDALTTRVAMVPKPAADPAYGKDGPLASHWP